LHERICVLYFAGGVDDQFTLLPKLFVRVLHDRMCFNALVADAIDLVVLLVEVSLIVKQLITSVLCHLHVNAGLAVRVSKLFVIQLCFKRVLELEVALTKAVVLDFEIS